VCVHIALMFRCFILHWCSVLCTCTALLCTYFVAHFLLTLHSLCTLHGLCSSASSTGSAIKLSCCPAGAQCCSTGVGVGACCAAGSHCCDSSTTGCCKNGNAGEQAADMAVARSTDAASAFVGPVFPAL
jgi:hypothetical protein